MALQILYGVPISESKLDRIVRLNARATVHVLVDHPEHIAMLQRYALAHGVCAREEILQPPMQSG
jgi:D-serine deaminase-like pyridoxal phosphate-dependent protein